MICRRRMGWVAGVLLQAVTGVAVAAPQVSAMQPTLPAPASTNAVFLENLDAQLGAISNSVVLAESARTNLIRVYLQARDRLVAAEKLARQAEEFVREGREAPALVADLQLQLDQPPVQVVPRVQTNAPVSVLEQAVTLIEAELNQARAQKQQIDQEPMRRAERTMVLAGLLATAQPALQSVDQQLKTSPQGPLWAQAASRIALLAERRYRAEEIAAYESELENFNSTGNLLILQQGLAARQEKRLLSELEMVRNALRERRAQESAQAEARAKAGQARAEVFNQEIVQNLAEANETLAQDGVTLSEKLNLANMQVDEATKELLAIRDKFNDVRVRVETVSRVGLNRNYALGLALRRQEYSLPNIKRYEADIYGRLTELSEAQLKQLTLFEQSKDLADVETQLASIRTRLSSGMPAWETQEILDECRRLLEEKRDLLTDLMQEYQRYVEELLQLNLVEGDLAREVKAFKEYISERVLWIRSTDYLTARTIIAECQMIWSVLSDPKDLEVFDYLREDLKDNYLIYVSVGLLFGLLIAQQKSLRHRIRQAGSDAFQGNRCSLGPSIRALLYTLLIALPWPLFFYFLSWRLRASYLTLAVADRLSVVTLTLAIGLFSVIFLRQLCREHGLGEAHFQWPLHNMRIIRRHLTWFIPVMLPIAFFTLLLEGVFVEGLSNRLFYMPSMIVTAILFHLWLNPRHGLRLGASQQGPSSGRKPIWPRVWHLTLVGIPLLMVVASAVGYTYTARKFWINFSETFWILLCFLLLRALIFHWIALLRRRMALRQSELRLEQEGASPQLEGAESAAYEGLPPDKVAQELDLKLVHAQARTLLNVAIGILAFAAVFGIWTDFFPAFRFLDRVQLWQAEASPPSVSPKEITHAGPVTGMIGSSSGEVGPASAQAPMTPPLDGVGPAWRWVTLEDLMFALLVISLTLLVSKNLSGFLEIVLLSRLRLLPGEGYALTTLLRYLVFLIGLIWATGLLGLTWTRVQWLAAAVTVGIGFGLQEIFANFVSGLIIFFERPVRLGDTVTVGDVSGVVTRIQIRATTLREWDNKELILPNKEFITGRFINWSLTDSVVRLICAVGVSYGTDVRKAQELLLKAAHNHLQVLADPPPSALFRHFGESSLEFELRAYVNNPNTRLQVIHDLNLAIIDSFREAGIEIAFPQRDLHIRTLPEGVDLSRRRPDEKSPPPSREDF